MNTVGDEDHSRVARQLRESRNGATVIAVGSRNDRHRSFGISDRAMDCPRGTEGFERG
jgi:hypothetical protein